MGVQLCQDCINYIMEFAPEHREKWGQVMMELEYLWFWINMRRKLYD